MTHNLRRKAPGRGASSRIRKKMVPARDSFDDAVNIIHQWSRYLASLTARPPGPTRDILDFAIVPLSPFHLMPVVRFMLGTIHGLMGQNMHPRQLTLAPTLLYPNEHPLANISQ